VNARVLSTVAVGLVAFLSACASREKVSLAYAGKDARNSAEQLSRAISERGLSPVCKERKFCKFEHEGGGTVHFKLTKDEPILVLETPEDLTPEVREQLQAEMREVAMAIWKDASSVALAEESEATRLELAREEEERRRDDEKYRLNTAARLESERIQAQKEIESSKVAALEAERANQARADAAAAAAAAASEVREQLSYEARSRGSAIRVELPEAAQCSVKNDQGNGPAKMLEIPFQIETWGGSYTTVECDLGPNSRWRKKLQAKDGQTTVVRLSIGG
jgi:hypothetical protein